LRILRNKANFGFNWFNPDGLHDGSWGRGGSGRVVFECFTGGLQFGEDLQVAVELTMGGIDAALQVIELLAGEDVGGDHGVVADGVGQAHVPGGGFEPAEADQEPGLVDEGGDEGFLFGGGGLEAVEEVVTKGVEGGLVFADEGVGFGEDAVFEGVEADGGFAFVGTGSGRFESVAAIGLDLFVGCHCESFVGEVPCKERSRGGLGEVRRKIPGC